MSVYKNFTNTNPSIFFNSKFNLVGILYEVFLNWSVDFQL